MTNVMSNGMSNGIELWYALIPFIVLTLLIISDYTNED
jgi:hypothetical protein